ncbi:hypothetical protein FGADI_10804 [Fusarium gaditjirri]|uniref:Sterol uptake control protein 2 n=1 Tax=Fusarium gaditjirri TaxID=282569 RepID=A0A8H4WR16_9HYPO|nr:hypothetical protein FGADI_10804 [Fusarium gaditjirri]
MSSVDSSSDSRSSYFPNLSPSNSTTAPTLSSLDNHHLVNSPDAFGSCSHPSPTQQIAPFPPRELWARDCELMHHYCTVTADTLCVRKDLAYVWGVAIPRLGYQDPFVMHGILAIAAAHKAYLVPANRKTYLPLADYHQTLGSEGYRRYLQHYNMTNWMPVFGFASLVVLHMLTLPTRMDNCVLEDPITNLVELAGLLRGIKTTLEPAMGRIVRTEFAPVVFGIWVLGSDDEAERYPYPGCDLTWKEANPSYSCPSLENSSLPTDTWVALQRLRAFQEAYIPASGLQHYTAALEGLETSARLFAAAGLHAEVAAAHFWLYIIDDSILIDLAAQRPHALLLFAHYLVHWAVFEKGFWFTRGWSRQVMVKIEEGLSGRPNFLEMMQWPKQMVAEAVV